MAIPEGAGVISRRIFLEMMKTIMSMFMKCAEGSALSSLDYSISIWGDIRRVFRLRLPAKESFGDDY